MSYPFEASASPAPLKFDRRRYARLPSGGSFVVAYHDENGAGITRVELLDSSATGLGLRSPVPLSPGTRLSLFIEGNTLPGRTGVVVRCEKDARGFRAGLACDARVAA